jgi:hypothetical protein
VRPAYRRCRPINQIRYSPKITSQNTTSSTVWVRVMVQDLKQLVKPRTVRADVVRVKMAVLVIRRMRRRMLRRVLAELRQKFFHSGGLKWSGPR